MLRKLRRQKSGQLESGAAREAASNAAKLKPNGFPDPDPGWKHGLTKKRSQPALRSYAAMGKNSRGEEERSYDALRLSQARSGARQEERSHQTTPPDELYLRSRLSDIESVSDSASLVNPPPLVDGLGLAWPSSLSFTDALNSPTSPSPRYDAPSRRSSISSSKGGHGTPLSPTSSLSGGLRRALHHSKSTSSLNSTRSRSTTEHSETSSTAHFRNPSLNEWLVDNPVILTGDFIGGSKHGADAENEKEEIADAKVRRKGKDRPAAPSADQTKSQRLQGLARELQLSIPKEKVGAVPEPPSRSPLRTPVPSSTSQPKASPLKKEPVPSIDEIIKKHSPAMKQPATFVTSSNVRAADPEDGDSFSTPTLASSASFRSVSDSSSLNGTGLRAPFTPLDGSSSYASSSYAQGKSNGKTYNLVTEPILSIDEIIKAHLPSISQPSIPLVKVDSRSVENSPHTVRVRSAARSHHQNTAPSMGQASEWESEGSSASAYDTDDSVQREVTQSIKAAKRKAKLEKRIMDRTERQKEEEEERERQALLAFRQLRQHAKAFEPDSSDEGFQLEQSAEPTFLRTSPLNTRRRTASAASTSSGRSAQSAALAASRKLQAKQAAEHQRALESLLVLKYLRSDRLTTIVKLRKWPHEGLQVSLADVGDPNGLPVFVYLGLGAVRYLVGLYDEMSRALGIRLVCVDRWGLGKTDEIPTSKRGVLDWASVIAEVADKLEIGRFAMLAHSAGAPFAMATALTYPNRVIGPVHLLAPWVSASVESGYNWLKYVPDRIIKTAQAAEWKMQGWKLGKLPSMTEAEIISKNTILTSIDTASLEPTQSRRSSMGYERSPISPPTGNDAARDSDTGLYSKSPRSKGKGFGGLFGPRTPGGTPRLGHKGSSASLRSHQIGIGSISSSPNQDNAEASNYFDLVLSNSLGEAPVGKGRRSSSLSIAGKDASSWASRSMTTGAQSHNSNSGDETISLATTTPSSIPESAVPRRARRGSTACSIASNQTSSSNANAINSAALAGDVATALLQASHAESTKGGAADLLCILGRTGGKAWGFSYTDVKCPVKIWHGDRDEKISMAGVEWMQREMPKLVDLKIVKGAGHGLMTNVGVVIEALER